MNTPERPSASEMLRLGSRERAQRLAGPHAVRPPVFETMGMRGVDISDSGARLEMSIGPMSDRGGGRVLPGALGVVADSSIGLSYLTHLADGLSMVTAQLRVEFLDVAVGGVGVVTATGRFLYGGEGAGLASAELVADDGTVLALASGRFVHVPAHRAEQHVLRPPTTERDTSAAGHGLAEVHDGAVVVETTRVFPEALLERFAVRPRRVSDGAVLLSVASEPTMCNMMGGVHGGAVSMLCSGSQELALLSVEGVRAVTVLDLQIEYLRPIARDTGDFDVVSEVTHAGRSFCVVTTHVVNTTGKLAALARGSFLVDR